MSVDNEALNTVIKKLNNSYQIWLIVGICQIVFGFWYVTPIFFGAWNIYCAVNRKKLAEHFRQDPTGLAETAKSWKDSIVVFIILNAVFGALIGVIGCAYDYSIASYSESHEQELNEAALLNNN
jgi:uncharacterized ion transporter superfamily protein YfcC